MNSEISSGTPIPFKRGMTFSDPAGQLARFSQISDVRAYWEALRDGRLAPCRSEIDPRGIEHALEYAFVLERIAPGTARFRLAGMHIGNLMGMEVRGMPLTAIFTAAARPQIEEVLDSVFAGPRVAELALTGESGAGRSSLQAQMLLLPLRSDLGDVSRALGCLVSQGPIGPTPRRLNVSSKSLVEIECSARAPEEGRRLTAPTPGFSERSTAFRPAPGPATPARRRGRGHLRLVVSDE